MSEGPGYNERIFSKGLRARLHHARFYWLREKVKALFDERGLNVLELGCFDAKTISFLPTPPARYAGFDANWENGLDIARANFRQPEYRFSECAAPEEMRVDGEHYDLAVCMETLEHIPDGMLDGYLKKFQAVNPEVLLVTVPNEMGPLFLAKYLTKRIAFRERMNPHYSGADVLNQTLGRMDRVVHDDHKGFDYRELIRRLRENWVVVSVESIPFSLLPPGLSFSIGLVCRPKR